MPKSRALLAALLLLPTTGLLAWGDTGHRTVAHIAIEHLTPEAEAGLLEFLASPESLPDYASWADRVRGERRESAPWHYINYPLALDHPDFDIFAQPEGNVVTAIHNQAAILADESQPRELRREALYYVVHFVGDLHQPLHAGSGEDLGANRVKVRWGSRVTNLHATWDSAVINSWNEDAPTIARRLQAGITAEDVEAIRAGGPYDWMVESHVLAREVAYANFPREAAGDVMTTETLGLLRDLWGDDALPEGATFTDDVSDEDAPDLSGEYATIARPTIETRLLQGGLRLSRVLNDVFATPPVLPQTPTSRLPR